MHSLADHVQKPVVDKHKIFTLLFWLWWLIDYIWKSVADQYIQLFWLTTGAITEVREEAKMESYLIWPNGKF